MSRQQSQGNDRVTTIILALLIPAGLALCYAIFVRPVTKVVAARGWTETPCVITSSRVGTSHDKKGGRTYRVDISFKYKVNGEVYNSDEYQFDEGYSSGYALKEAVVNQYPPDQQSVCYVNPADPEEAVMVRGFTPGLLWGLAPLALTGAGILGLVSARNARLGKPVDPAKQNAIALVVFALISDAVVCGAVFFQLIPEARIGAMEWGLLIFLIPFALVSVLFTWAAVTSVRKLLTGREDD